MTEYVTNVQKVKESVRVILAGYCLSAFMRICPDELLPEYMLSAIRDWAADTAE